MEHTQDQTCLDVEFALDRDQFVRALRSLADAVEAGGAFEYEVGGERIAVPPSASFSVERERSGDEEELEFQIKWDLATEGVEDDLP